MVAARKRILVQVTPVEKRAIASTAKRLGHNVSELMCEAVQGITTSDDEEIINVSTPEANDALDDALSFVAESNKPIAAMTGVR
jgi:hypothetical protein